MEKAYKQKRVSGKKSCAEIMLVLGILFLFIFAILLSRCSIVQMEKNNKIVINYVDTLKLKQSVRDSVVQELNSEIRKKLPVSDCDSLLRQFVLETHGDYNGRLDNALADLRQELNNQINMLNLWVGIWIMIIGLLGGLFPLAINFVQRKNFQKELAKMDEHFLFETTKLNERIVIGRINYIINSIVTLKNMGHKYSVAQQKTKLGQLLRLLSQYNNEYIGMLEEKEIEAGKDLVIYIWQFRTMIASIETLYTNLKSIKQIFAVKNAIEVIEKEFVLQSEGIKTSIILINSMKRLQVEVTDLVEITDRER